MIPDGLVVCALLVSAWFLVLVVASMIHAAGAWARRRRYTPPADCAPSATSSQPFTLADLERFEESIDPAMAERRRRAFEACQARVIAEARAAHAYGRDTSGKRYQTAAEFLRDLSRHPSRRRDW